VFVGIQLGGNPDEKLQLIARLNKRGYDVVDMSDNEIAKIHIRHMVGGHAPGLPNEALFRFEFPERPGALLRFLQGLSGRWNISLFH
jgi:threonine dehydratase